MLTSSGIHAGGMKLNLLPIMRLKLNRISTAQECDATMLNQWVMLVTKKLIIDN
jgi:hypothetical protein